MGRLLRAAGRAGLAAIFINSGVNMIREADAYTKRAAAAVPGLPEDPAVGRAYGAAMLAGGSLLAIGVLPRLAAAGLALALLPNTYIGHPFWSQEDPAARRMHLTHFFKNVGLFGGLLYVVGSTSRRAG